MAREGQVCVQGLGRGAQLCSANVGLGAGAATPAVALASTASAVAQGDKALESTTEHNSPLPEATPAAWSYSPTRG